MKENNLLEFLNAKVQQYNQPSFIKDDPVSIPHLFKKKQDIEIAGLFAAVFAWGNRTTIIQKSKELMALMNNEPHAFILNHHPADLQKLFLFKHRTFNTTDLLYFIDFLKMHYERHESLETAFINPSKENDSAPKDVENALMYFHNYFFSLEDAPTRTKKHIPTPLRNSSCKRLNMFLRWMVRKDNKGVDFGIWNSISPADLICPLDLHVARVAKRFELLTRKQSDWQAALELTNYLKTLDTNDPVKYDFALFGLGAIEKYS